MTIVEFLTARLDEREKAALACTAAWPEAEKIYDEVYRLALPTHDDQETDEWDVRIRREEARFIASNGPAVVLADIAVKRAVIERYVDSKEWGEQGHHDEYASEAEGLETAITLLASAYADRPGYDPEWKP